MDIQLDDPESLQLLARAFDPVCERYYRPAHNLTIVAETARPVLASHLVELAKNGMKEEGALAAGGLLHLISLPPQARDGSA
jgi:hypothetical protein